MTLKVVPSRESATLDKAIDSMTRLNPVLLDGPAARLLQQQFNEVTELRNRIREREDAEAHSTSLLMIAAGPVAVLIGIGAAVSGACDLVTSRTFGSVLDVGALVAGPLIAALFAYLSLESWPEVRRYRASRRARRHRRSPRSSHLRHEPPRNQ
jgi:hypothetical protein